MLEKLLTCVSCGETHSPGWPHSCAMPGKEQDDEILIESEEFKARYIKHLTDNGLDDDMAIQDYEAFVESNIDDEDNPEFAASESLSRYTE